MLMTPTSASRSSVMKSFIKRNTPLRVDPKVREAVPQAALRERLRLRQGAVTWHRSRAGSGLFGRGCPGSRGPSRTRWVLCCGREAWPSPGDPGAGKQKWPSRPPLPPAPRPTPRAWRVR